MPTPNLGLPQLAADQAQKHVTVNEALNDLDALVQLSVLDRSLSAPPGSPPAGGRYLVAANPTGAWTNHANHIAAWLDGGWRFFVPGVGWLVYVVDEQLLLAWNGSAWVNALAAFQNLPMLGVNTAADSSNRLAAKTNAVLLSHDDVTPGTGDLRVTLNKSAVGKDAGFTFQDAFGTRALLGLLGDDHFAIKVSPDGSAFYPGLVVDKGTGNVAIGAGADANNKLLVQGQNVLFTNNGTLAFSFNKGASNNDCSLTFQTAFSAKALIGLLGNDDFTFKVTPDGATYFAGIRTRRDLHGRVDLKASSRRSCAEWIPQPGVAAISANGLSIVGTGTLTLVNPTASNLFTQSPRVKYVSAAAAGSSCGANGGGLYLWRGNAASLGGFYLCMRGGIETFQATCRMFMGLYASAAAIGNANPSTLLNMVGIGFDSGQTTLRLFRNDGAGAATAIDLGAGFPTTGGQDLYELILSAEPNGSEIKYRVERLNGGNVAEGALTTDLPVNTQFLTPHFWFNNGTTAAAVELAIVGMYAENASLLGSRGAIG